MDSIYNFINEYNKKDICRFHMPGHKGNEAFIFAGPLKYDITEIPGADMLYNPCGIIRDFSHFLAETFGKTRERQGDGSSVLRNAESAFPTTRQRNRPLVFSIN